MDFPILINWMSPLSFVGTEIAISHFYFQFSMKFISANRIAPDGTPLFGVSHSGIFCLHMSYKKDARLVWVNFDI